MEMLLLLAGTLTVPRSVEATVLSTPPTGTALHLLLSHWHTKRKEANNTKQETWQERGRGAKTEGNETWKHWQEENGTCSWSCPLLRRTCFLYLLLFSFFHTIPKQIPITWVLAYFSSVDVQPDQETRNYSDLDQRWGKVGMLQTRRVQ